MGAQHLQNPTPSLAACHYGIRNLLPGGQPRVPLKDGFKSNDPRLLREDSPAKTPADLGQSDALRICEPQSPSDLAPEDSVFHRQILVAQQKFLINGAGEVGEQSLPVHRGKVNQRSGRGSTVRLPPKSLPVGPFERFDPTAFERATHQPLDARACLRIITFGSQ
jgi:hypothetical protein